MHLHSVHSSGYSLWISMESESSTSSLEQFRSHSNTKVDHLSFQNKERLTVPIMTEVQYEKVFNDSVHGHIKLHPLCVKIIDTLQFQRLRNLKQLGTTYLVFPAACGKRFEHSLGVAYLAGQMVDALRFNCPEVTILPEEKLSVEIAGLCHDLGHGPFSHLWEHFLGDCDIKWRHENCSIAMLKHLVKVNNLEDEFKRYNIDVDLIAELIMGEGTKLPKKQYLYQIVNNKLNDIDVDKWDYFLRDGKQLNIPISFDYRRLLAFCRLVKSPVTGDLVIGFRNKEAVTINELFRVRADLHLRAYQHPVVKVIELMFVDAFVDAKDDYKVNADGRDYRLHEAQENMNAMSQLSDHIQYVIQNNFSEEHPARKKLERIARRKLYPQVVRFNVDQVLDNNAPYIKKSELIDVVKDLRKILNEQIPDHKFSVDALRLDFGSHENPLSKVVFFKKPSSNQPQSELEVDHNILEDISKILPTQLNTGNKIEILVFAEQIDDRSVLKDTVLQVCHQNLPDLVDSARSDATLREETLMKLLIFRCSFGASMALEASGSSEPREFLADEMS